MLLCDICVNTSPKWCVVINSDEIFQIHLLQPRQADSTQKTFAEDKLRYIHGNCAHIATIEHIFTEHFWWQNTK
jgi:hypothetical protein